MVRGAEALCWHATLSKICSHSPRLAAAEGGMEGPEVEVDRKIRDQDQGRDKDKGILQRAVVGRVLEA